MDIGSKDSKETSQIGYVTFYAKIVTTKWQKLKVLLKVLKR